MTDAPKPDDPRDIAPWSPQSQFSELHSATIGLDPGQVPGYELPTSSAARDRDRRRARRINAGDGHRYPATRAWFQQTRTMLTEDL
ncbi:hypothetical protein [Nocardia sp. A7]|uniref:hypothetical protein n=1 Tax=Nocardia sp. A7 TaxID=2789274 RepID=UPI00397CCFFA